MVKLKINGIPVEAEEGTTIIEAARLAGIGCGFWKLEDFVDHKNNDTIYEPHMEQAEADHLYARWQKAVAAARMFPVE